MSDRRACNIIIFFLLNSHRILTRVNFPSGDSSGKMVIFILWALSECQHRGSEHGVMTLNQTLRNKSQHENVLSVKPIIRCSLAIFEDGSKFVELGWRSTGL